VVKIDRKKRGRRTGERAVVRGGETAEHHQLRGSKKKKKLGLKTEKGKEKSVKLRKRFMKGAQRDAFLVVRYFSTQETTGQPKVRGRKER